MQAAEDNILHRGGKKQPGWRHWTSFINWNCFQTAAYLKRQTIDRKSVV